METNLSMDVEKKERFAADYWAEIDENHAAIKALSQKLDERSAEADWLGSRWPFS
jgi:hypothetical protein